MGTLSRGWRPLGATLWLWLGAAVACAVSLQREIQLGQDYAAEIDRTMPVVHDAAVQAAMDQTARPVLAMASRGDYDQLAGVLGHEIGHVDLRHSARQMEKAQAATLGVNLGYILLGRQPGETESTALNIAASVIFAKFSRDDERQADHAAVRYLSRAGINPGGISSMFGILQQLEARQPDALAQFFASHPMTADRIADVDRVIAADTAAQRAVRTGVTDRPVFHQLQRAVRGLPPPAKPN